MITDYGEIPDPIMTAIRNHVDHGRHVGSFTTAVLENDLATAVLRGDENSLRCLQAIVKYVYNDIPSRAWGSQEKVAKWRQNIAQLCESTSARHLTVAS